VLASKLAPTPAWHRLNSYSATNKKDNFIPTPVGPYNPDWAIAFKDGDVKHVFFIAETKGSMSSMDLRKVEQVKIDCARRFFGSIADEKVTYGVVDSYDQLMDLVK